MSLREYRAKRNFKKSAEPAGSIKKELGTNIFVIQKHHAGHLHYDFRLELDGVLKSWAVPKGPSLNPHDKRLAIEVEDHPIDYANFEGEIPADEYGGGHVIVWDKGEWIPPPDAEEQLKNGKLEFELHGKKLEGTWLLLRTKIPNGKKKNWLLIKRNDASANTENDITKKEESVISGLTLDMLEHKINTAQKKSKILDFSDIKGPELATLMNEPPVGENWIHEIKFDGYRTFCRKDKNHVKLLTRSGLDWSHKYKNLQLECEKIPADTIVMDGEVVWLDKNGHSNFTGLQNALEKETSSELVYYVFDLLYLNGYDTRQLPLKMRKQLLEEVISKSDSDKIIYSHHWDENGASVYKNACDNKLEGIVSKDIESHYVSGRNKKWQKIKCTNIQEFVIGGYTLQKVNQALGAILMGAINKDGQFQYVGKVGTGFGNAEQQNLLAKLKKIQRKKSPFEIKSPDSSKIFWVKPEMVANVEFGAWTKETILRHAAFKGLREDKKANEVELETVETLKKENEDNDFNLSHPDKILFHFDYITKYELATYYENIQKWMIPYVKNRPLAILRCPDGIEKMCFFQKHLGTEPTSILSKTVTSLLKNKKENIILINSAQGLTALVQLGTIEIHARGGIYTEIDFPNQIVFDFDPDIGVSFQKVKEASFKLKEVLESLKLRSFIKTSGIKGLHVHVPIAPIYNWDEIKNFSKSICVQLEIENPDKFTTKTSKEKRKGKIFLDYLRNGYGALVIAPYSVRAQIHAPVAFPISWEEVRKLKSPDHYTLTNVPSLLKKRKDPWNDFFKLKQRIKILDDCYPKGI